MLVWLSHFANRNLLSYCMGLLRLDFSSTLADRCLGARFQYELPGSRTGSSQDSIHIHTLRLLRFSMYGYPLHRLVLFLLTPIFSTALTHCCLSNLYLYIIARTKMTAAEYLARGRIKSSGTDKDILNGEEVKKELSHATKRNYKRALTLWEQYVNRQMPRTSVPTDSRSTDIKSNSHRPAHTT